jgi:hypothetical protein
MVARSTSSQKRNSRRAGKEKRRDPQDRGVFDSRLQSESVARTACRCGFGIAQAVAFGAVQGLFGFLAQGRNVGLVLGDKAGLIGIELAGGGIIALAHDLFLGADFFAAFLAGAFLAAAFTTFFLAGFLATVLLFLAGRLAAAFTTFLDFFAGGFFVLVAFLLDLAGFAAFFFFFFAAMSFTPWIV